MTMCPHCDRPYIHLEPGNCITIIHTSDCPITDAEDRSLRQAASCQANKGPIFTRPVPPILLERVTGTGEPGDIQ